MLRKQAKFSQWLSGNLATIAIQHIIPRQPGQTIGEIYMGRPFQSWLNHAWPSESCKSELSPFYLTPRLGLLFTICLIGLRKIGIKCGCKLLGSLGPLLSCVSWQETRLFFQGWLIGWFCLIAGYIWDSSDSQRLTILRINDIAIQKSCCSDIFMSSLRRSATTFQLKHGGKSVSKCMQGNTK